MSVREVIYFALASALGLFTFVFYIFSKNPRAKDRMWTVVHVLGGALFIAFMLGRDLGMIGTFFTVFGTLGFVYLSLGNSRFCDSCSALIFGPERPEWRGKCPSCGATLPWSEFYPPESGDSDSSETGALAPALERSQRETAEIARAFDTEGEQPAVPHAPSNGAGAGLKAPAEPAAPELTESPQPTTPSSAPDPPNSPDSPAHPAEHGE